MKRIVMLFCSLVMFAVASEFTLSDPVEEGVYIKNTCDVIPTDNFIEGVIKNKDGSIYGGYINVGYINYTCSEEVKVDKDGIFKIGIFPNRYFFLYGRDEEIFIKTPRTMLVEPTKLGYNIWEISEEPSGIKKYLIEMLMMNKEDKKSFIQLFKN